MSVIDAFSKIYSLINWKNRSESMSTPLGATNMNKMDSAINTLDDRVVTLDTTKADQTTVLKMVQDVDLDLDTGVLTITKLDGTTKTWDTNLEKIAVNFDFDEHTQIMTITLDDGSTKTIDLRALITQFEFLDSDTIAHSFEDNYIDVKVPNGGYIDDEPQYDIESVKNSKSVKLNIKESSVKEKHLDPKILANVKLQTQNAQQYAEKASGFADDASDEATLAKSYAVGGTDIRDGEDTDNAKYYSEQAETAYQKLADAGDYPTYDETLDILNDKEEA